MALLRRLNDQGLKELEDFLTAVKANADTPVPVPLLTDLRTSEELPTQIEVRAGRFGSRAAVATYLDGLFSSERASGLDKDPGMWAWLSLFWFDELCPRKRDGSPDPKDITRWIPSGVAFRYYRHLLAGPYLIHRIFRATPERAKIVLCGPLDKPGEIVEQLASRQEIITCQTIIETATRLYYDERTGTFKRGAAGKNAPGTSRRFADIINQLDRTWDFRSMSADALIRKLPGEFDRFRPKQAEPSNKCAFSPTPF